MAQSTEARFTVLLPGVFSFEYGVEKNECRISKVYAVFIKVFLPFACIPLKARADILYGCIYNVKSHPVVLN